jgi:hypothetical protein
MEQWALNTLRIIGIILTAGFALVAGLFLFLMSMCAYGGDLNGMKHPDEVIPYLEGGIAVMAAGGAISVFLARGIVRPSRSPVTVRATGFSAPQSTAPEASPAIELSPTIEKAIEPVVFAMAVQIGLSALVWFWAQRRFWTPPYRIPNHHWAVILLTPFVLYHIPYGILIYLLLKKPDRRAFTYSVVVPAVLILQGLLSFSLIALTYNRHPIALLLTFVPRALHIVVLVLAWQVIERLRVALIPSSLVIAALVTFFYFSILQMLTPLLYKFAWSLHG